MLRRMDTDNEPETNNKNITRFLTVEQGCYLRYSLRVHFNLSSYLFSIFISRNDSSPKNRHRERIVGWVGKYSILSIQFSRKMTRRAISRGPPPLFQPNIIAGTRMRDEKGGREGESKEKNKFDQSEGGGYRFGYGFRKRRRILFLRKPDKGPFTRIFSHTRRLHLVSLYTIHASIKNKEMKDHKRFIVSFLFFFHFLIRESFSKKKKKYIELKVFKNVNL